MLTVAGGKLTTYRRIALSALAALRAELGGARIATIPAPLPGALQFGEAVQRLAAAHPELEPALRSHLAHFYGSRAGEVLALAENEPELLEPLHPRAPDIAAQAAYARERECACTADDVLRRRTTLAARGLATSDVEARVARILGSSSPARR